MKFNVSNIPVVRSTKNWWQQNNIYYKIAAVCCVCIAVAGGSYVLYRWYRGSREANAHKSLNDCLVIYKDALDQQTQARSDQQKNQNKNLWEEAEIAMRLGYEQNKDSRLAPFFLALQADALLALGHKAQALEVLSRALAELSSSSPYYGLYRTKRALMYMDDEATREQGLAELEQLKHDKKNKFKDMTLFYLGSYFWSINDNAQARGAWQQLIDEFGSLKDAAASPWVEQARTMLASIPESN